MNDFRAFVKESNRIEGILRAPTDAEMEAHKTFVALDKVTEKDVTTLVTVLKPAAVLRSSPEVPRVRVGNHVAPPSGPMIAEELDSLLADVNAGTVTPWQAHRRYENLHPYTDVNGRSGRALWLWQMVHMGRSSFAFRLGFLHAFYYQTLDESR